MGRCNARSSNCIAGTFQSRNMGSPLQPQPPHARANIWKKKTDRPETNHSREQHFWARFSAGFGAFIQTIVYCKDASSWKLQNFVMENLAMESFGLSCKVSIFHPFWAILVTCCQILCPHSCNRSCRVFAQFVTATGASYPKRGLPIAFGKFAFLDRMWQLIASKQPPPVTNLEHISPYP